MHKILQNAIGFLVFLFVPLSVMAQTPPVGTTADFVLFTSVGAVGNTGLSQVTGNVGTNNGAITGFGNVNGTMHNANGATATAAADLLIAYNFLNALVPTFFKAPLFGNGETLTAGVYQIAGVSTLSGDLILDGQGNANAIFVFQLQAAFSSTANARIILINGAQACNVFWKVEGAVNLGTSTSMKGTIIANNGAIDMASGTTLEGRALSTAGAITINTVLAYIPAGCGKPLLSGPVAPTFGASGCFALFSGIGEVTNAGISTIIGDVGTNMGITTGYNPLLVTGTIHPIPDEVTALAAPDVMVIYNYLNVLPHDIELLYPAQFGNDLVLTPHTYLLNAATSLTGKLYLNAGGDTNAVFVIKINGALSTSTYSEVILMNRANAANVFWKVDGAVVINDYSKFSGTIIANNGAISLATGVELKGRAFTTVGALSTAAITTTLAAGTCTPILPVNWLYFRGTPVVKSVVLEWGTSAEINNAFFNIERSRNGSTFTSLATVNAHTNGMVQNTYTFKDNQPYPIGYYRLAQTDRDGKINYSRTIMINMQAAQQFAASYYMMGNMIRVQASGATPAQGLMELFSLDGRKISSQKILLTKETAIYHMDKPATHGVYILHISSNGKRLYADKILVQ